MADNNFRSNRPTDQRWPSQPTPAPGGRQGANDPLAELARLIGQTDPFADIAPRADAAPRRPSTPAPQPAPSYPSDPYGAPISAQPFHAGPFEGEPRQDGFRPPDDPAMYGNDQRQAYPSEAYYDDPARIPQGDEAYAEDCGEERPRRGLKLILLLAGVAIIGTGAAFGYRALYSGPGKPPPVIKANTSPSKVVPAPNSDANNNNKMIYDRVGDASQTEKVVPREEKPVEVKDTSRPSPRAVLPGMQASPQDSTSVAMTSPPLTTDSVGPSIGEPKKVRTVTIRPDQAMNGAPAARQNGTGTRTASTAPAPTPRETAPAPAPIAAAPPPSSNAPLSLNPQAANAEASARPAAPRSAPPAPTRLAAAPPAQEVASGSYTVQLSSQRSENEAQSAFRSLQAKFPSLLGDRQPIIRRADLGDRGIYYRAMVGPFASVDQATHFCGSLKSAGGQCVVQRN